MADVVPIRRHKDYKRHNRRSAAGCLRAARGYNPVEVLVIGVDGDGDCFVQAHPPEPGNAFWLMEMAKAKLLGLHNR